MTAFWHWFVVIITLAFTLAMVLLFVVTGKTRIPPQTDAEGNETTGHVWDHDLKELNHPMPRWWLGLFYATVVFALLYLVLYPGLGRYAGFLEWTSEDQYQAQMAAATARFNEQFGALAARPIEELSRHPDALRMGRNLFAHHCSTCHGADARGAPGYPNLTDDHWIWGGQAEQILTTIRDGRQAAMPGFASVLDDQAVTRTAVYVQKLAGQTVDSVLATAGKRQFETICAACHGLDGTGNPLLGAPNLTRGVYTYGGNLSSLRQTIRHGRQGIMPAQEDLLGEARTRLVAAYVMSLSTGPDDHE